MAAQRYISNIVCINMHLAILVVEREDIVYILALGVGIGGVDTIDYDRYMVLVYSCVYIGVNVCYDTAQEWILPVSVEGFLHEYPYMG